MTALTVDKESRRSLDALLAEIAPPPVITDKATLEDMLAEGEKIRRRGRSFLCLPPSIRDMISIQRLMADIQETTDDEERQLALQFRIASFLFWVEEGKTLRPATRADLESCFSLGSLTKRILDILARNGMETDAKNE